MVSLSRTLKTYRSRYHTYQKGKQRCFICFEPLNNDKSFNQRFTGNPYLCCTCQILPKRRVVEFDGIKVISYFDYDEKFRKLLLRYKESGDKVLAPIFLHHIYLELILRHFNHLFVCAPSRLESQCKRGFLHLERMLEIYGLETINCLWNDSEDDQTQANDRSLISNNIHYVPNTLLKHRNIVLFDDVMTSGSTIKACIDALRGQCKSITVVILARTTKK